MRISNNMRKRLGTYSGIDLKILEANIEAAPEDGSLGGYLRERANYHKMEYRTATAELLLEFAKLCEEEG